MKYLLDTHIFIWWSEDSPRLDKKIRSLIINSQNTVYVSIASVWETSIKLSLKKLHLRTSLAKLFDQQKIEIVPIKIEHAVTLSKLPHIHKDPFDRMLVAQAQSENLTLLTIDPKILQYYPHK